MWTASSKQFGRRGPPADGKVCLHDPYSVNYISIVKIPLQKKHNSENVFWINNYWITSTETQGDINMHWTKIWLVLLSRQQMRGWAGSCMEAPCTLLFNGVQEAILKWNTPIDNTYYNKIGSIENTHTHTYLFQNLKLQQKQQTYIPVFRCIKYVGFVMFCGSSTYELSHHTPAVFLPWDFWDNFGIPRFCGLGTAARGLQSLYKTPRAVSWRSWDRFVWFLLAKKTNWESSRTFLDGF